MRKDCFAYDSRKSRCVALNQLYCLRQECTFYKTKQEATAARKKALERALALPLMEQERIAEKYGTIL